MSFELGMEGDSESADNESDTDTWEVRRACDADWLST